VGSKDPGEFIEFHRNNETDGGTIADIFRQQVINTAKDWSEWFVSFILDHRYDENAVSGAGSFGGVFQRVAEFLAGFPNPADRTKSAVQVAGRLAAIMAAESNATSVSKAARMQLESDLIDTAARIAATRDAMKRRVDSISGGSPTESRALLSALAQGSGPMEKGGDIDKLSGKALRALARSEQTGGKGKEPNTEVKREVPRTLPPKEKRLQRRRMYRPPTERTAPSLTPHFAGFEFENQSDRDWLGIRKVRESFDLKLQGSCRRC
jgi:hypothetical protein